MVRTRSMALLIAVLMAGAIAPSAAMSQVLLIPWSATTSGGGRVTAPLGLALEGSIGQHDVGTSFFSTLRCDWGLWPGISSRCRADFNNSGAVTNQDFFDFLTAFFSNSPTADFNHDTSINSQDFFDFLAAFFAGCP